MGRGGRKPLLLNRTKKKVYQKIELTFNFTKEIHVKISKIAFNFQKKSHKKNRLQFYMEIPLLFSKNHKLETIFEKSHRSIGILKIFGASPQLVQNLTPIRKLFCTFLYQCCYYPRPQL